MIGIVIVSHSAKLADGVLELVNEMTQGRVPIAAAGGLTDADSVLGTDPQRVKAAIERVYSDEGVLVLMDLGSALMSAEMALEFLPPEQGENVYLIEAPLVEGGLAAAIQASAGSPMETVIAEARAAIAAKRAHLAPQLAPFPESAAGRAVAGDPDDWQQLEIIIPNQRGLHARPAARLIQLAAQFDAVLHVGYQRRRVDARSINQLVTLGARQGDRLTFYASGKQANSLLNAVQTLVDGGFGDRASIDVVPSAPLDENLPESIISGVSAAQGIAIGRVQRLTYAEPDLDMTQIDDLERDFSALQRAIDASLTDLERIIVETGGDEAWIFEAQRLILQDPDVLDQVRDHMWRTQHNASFAWWTVIQRIADEYRQLEASYLRQRAGDVVDVGRRVLSHLIPDGLPRQPITQTGILVAEDLVPSDTAQLDPQRVLGVVTAVGGATSHSAIIARALGIPAVVGVGNAIQQLSSGQTIAIDGAKGWVYLDPDDDVLNVLRQQRDIWRNQQAAFAEYGQQPAITRDGVRIDVVANIGAPDDVAQAVRAGADGIGLFRTELMFMGRGSPPDEETQVRAYRQVAAAMNGQPVIIRTLDVGGDKPIPYVTIPPENNPFLGYRGIRNWLEMSDLARTQLRAILRASDGYPLRVMFPMVSTLDELLRARALLDTVRSDLLAKGHRVGDDFQVGVMIEVPAAVMIADQLAAHVDFFSIGTNDLTQYLMAADRGNAHVTHLTDPFQPALLRAIVQTVSAAQQAGVRVGMCGEMAANPQAIPLLVGMGLDILSMGQHAIPEAKAIIRSLSLSTAQQLVTEAQQATSAAAVRELLSGAISP